MNYARRFPRGHWSFLGPGEKEKWYGTHTYKPEEHWNETADIMFENFKESEHPILRGISALNRGVLKRKGGKCTIQFTAESSECRALISHGSLSKSAQFLRRVASW